MNTPHLKKINIIELASELAHERLIRDWEEEIEEFMMSNTTARGGGIARVGGQMAGFARGGTIALAVAAILGIPMILNGIRKNTEKSANNSTKSITDRNQLISATVLQHGKG